MILLVWFMILIFFGFLWSSELDGVDWVMFGMVGLLCVVIFSMGTSSFIERVYMEKIVVEKKLMIWSL